MAYIHSLEAQEHPAAKKSEPVCFLCEDAGLDAASDAGREHLLLLNDERGMLLLNRYPYTNGHLLVAPREHVGDLTDLSRKQRGDLMELAVYGERVLREAVQPQGINIGVNLGRCAGAGLPGHVHVHILPRWNGDTNFMQTVGRVRVIPQALEESHAILLDAMKRVR